MPDLGPWWIVVGLALAGALRLLPRRARTRLGNWFNTRTTDIHLSIFGIDIGGRIAPNDVEKEVGWRLYFETATRISTDALPAGGDIREALTSLHKLLQLTRDTVREAGPRIAPDRPGETSVGQLAGLMIQRLRQFLGKWHPALSSWEHDGRFDDMVLHRATWPRRAELVDDLQRLRLDLANYSDQLRAIVGCAALDVATVREENEPETDPDNAPAPAG